MSDQPAQLLLLPHPDCSILLCRKTHVYPPNKTHRKKDTRAHIQAHTHTPHHITPHALHDICRIPNSRETNNHARLRHKKKESPLKLSPGSQAISFLSAHMHPCSGRAPTRATPYAKTRRRVPRFRSAPYDGRPPVTCNHFTKTPPCSPCLS